MAADPTDDIESAMKDFLNVPDEKLCIELINQCDGHCFVHDSLNKIIHDYRSKAKSYELIPRIIALKMMLQPYLDSDNFIPMLPMIKLSPTPNFFHCVEILCAMFFVTLIMMSRTIIIFLINGKITRKSSAKYFSVHEFPIFVYL